MKMYVAVAALSVLPLVLAGSSQGADAANGKALYQKGCAKCHGANGVGNPGLAKALGVAIRPLSDPDVQAKSDDQLAKESIAGVGKMKAVNGMTVEKDGPDIVAYIRSLKK
jgi:mono/diheme cytochrome c family protein